MRFALLAMAAAILIAAGSGCRARNLASNGCQSCGNGQGMASERIPHLPRDQGYTGPSGPPTAAYAYPYYTTRGPRDFLLDSPPTIGR